MSIGQTRGTASRVRLLVVDDNETMLTSIKAVIEVLRPSWDICISATASEGLETARRQEVDVALVDLELPDMPGLELCRRIKKARAIPVLVFSGAAWEAEQRARRTGAHADGYLDKPLSPMEVVERIEGALRRCAPREG